MKVSTIAMMLTLLVAGLAIGCSSAPEAPAAPVANLTEKEAIAIARTAYSKDYCWDTKPPSYPYEKTRTNFSRSESASFKPNGIWVVTAKSSYEWVVNRTTYPGGVKGETGTTVNPCTYVVNDATGRVTQN